MTPQDAMKLLDRGFDKLVNAKAKPGDIRHKDTLNEVLDAIRPACYGNAPVAHRPVAPRVLTPAEVEAQNRAVDKGRVCLTCGSAPCECKQPPGVVR